MPCWSRRWLSSLLLSFTPPRPRTADTSLNDTLWHMSILFRDVCARRSQSEGDQNSQRSWTNCPKQAPRKHFHPRQPTQKLAGGSSLRTPVHDGVGCEAGSSSRQSLGILGGLPAPCVGLSKSFSTRTTNPVDHTAVLILRSFTPAAICTSASTLRSAMSRPHALTYAPT